MSLVRVPVCARPGCGQLASTSARPSGSSAAYVPVCSQRCGYELIGPKRGATDDDADERDAAHQQLLVQRQEEKRRFDDLSAMSDIMAKLGRLRARLPEMTELEVATATLTIGRRLAADGSSTRQLIDALIFDVYTTMGHIVRGEPYDVPMVQARLARLRDDIAADASLDAFDAATGFELQRTGMPNDVRQLAAYRANPLQMLARFSFRNDGDFAIFFERNGSIDITIGESTYQPDGTELCWSDFRFINQRSYETKSVRLDSNNRYNWKITSSSVGRRIEISGQLNGVNITAKINRLYGTFVSRGDHAAYFLSKRDGTGVKYYRLGDQKSFDYIVTLPINTSSFRSSISVTIDSAGNIWCAALSGLYVFNALGGSIFVDADSRPIPAIASSNILGVASSADGCVWVCQSSAYSCTKYRLVPSSDYNRGV